MKITFDTNTLELKAKGKLFKDLSSELQDEVMSFLEKAKKLGNMSDYEEDSMWMSYRYCIGRHTIAAHQRAGDIAKNCYGRMTKDRSVFTAFDINREIESQLMHCAGVDFYFPSTCSNKIYTSALDIFCEFVNEYGINSKEDLLKYKEVHVKQYDNERGYALEVYIWKEWEEARFKQLCEKNGLDPKNVKELPLSFNENFPEFKEFYQKLEDHNNKASYFYLSSVDDLFVWNDLVHLFDIDHHHKSILSDNTEVEWFWTYDHDVIDNGDGTYRRKELGYRKIRVPVQGWNSIVTKWIPDEMIKENLY